MKKIIIILIFLLPVFTVAQDIHFSHVKHTKLLINPAFAGKNNLPNAVVGHRNFAPSGFGDYMSYHASYQQKIEAIHGGLGVHLLNDRQGEGVINRTYASAIYSYHFHIDNNITLQTALETRYALLSVNNKNLIFPNMFDPYSWEMKDNTGYRRENLTALSGSYLDFNAGVLMTVHNYHLRKYREFNLGFSVHHLTQPSTLMDDKNEKTERRYTLYSDIVVPLMNQRSMGTIPLLTPVFVTQLQGTRLRFNYGAYLSYSGFELGFLMNHNSLMHYINGIMYLGFKVSDVHLSYSYDATLLNKMKKNPISGAHEVTLSIDFQYKRDK